MSKYHYSSLLSSEFRKIFKQHHSLQKTEQQLSNNLYKCQRKQTPKSQTKPFNTYASSHVLSKNLTKNSQTLKPYSFGKFKPHECLSAGYLQQKASHSQISNKVNHSHFITNYRENNLLHNYQNRDKVGTILIQQPKYNLDTNLKFQSIRSRKDNQLKTKIIEINKRRNDCKMKVRINNIDQINKKYDYLKEKSIQKLSEEQVIKQQKAQLQYPAKYCSSESQILNHNQKKPHQAHQKSLLQSGNKRKFTENSFLPYNFNKTEMSQVPKYSKPETSTKKFNNDQNIQTPYFHQTQTKTAFLQPTLIEKKLQNLLKNTFTDRF